MEDIKIGEYVRIKNGNICKAIRITPYNYIMHETTVQNGYIYETDTMLKFIRSDILKHSKNIIDLIEEDDILLYTLNKSKILHLGKVRNYGNGVGIDFYKFEQLNIKKILTKEAFDNNCYKVGE